MEVIIIGAVAAGMTCASKLKRNLKENVNITVYEMGDEISFGACGIPFYISGKIEKSEDLIAKQPEDFKKSGIDVLIYHQVLKVDSDKKELTVKNLKTGDCFTKSYDKLVVGSGATVRKFPPFDKAYNNLYVVRNVNDGTKIKEALLQEANQNVVIVGAGFIGLELVEACKTYNKNVTLIELADRILAPMDEEITGKLTDELTKNGIAVETSCKVTEIIGESGRLSEVVVEKNGTTQHIQVDILINCAGIAPNTAFIESVEKAKNGAIIVNEKMETSVSDIYAAGDCSIMKNYITGQLTYAPLGTNANKQGRIIADVLSGIVPKPFKLIGSSAIKLFGLDAAKVGLSEGDAKSLGLHYKTNLITGNSYASYYGTEKLDIKVVYDAKTRVLLGAQTVGQGIVVPRANYYAIAIYGGLTVEEMGFMDLCYSPPFSGVWDAALIASNTAK